jgi:hypothetical protein
MADDGRTLSAIIFFFLQSTKRFGSCTAGTHAFQQQLQLTSMKRMTGALLLAGLLARSG